MGTFSTVAAVAACSVAFAGCMPRQDSTQQPSAAPAPSAGYSAYPPPAQTAYPQQGYPQPAPTYAQYPQAPPAPQPAPPPPAPAPVPPPAPSASATMAVPGPVALTCQNDVGCGTHRCNLQYGKCAFPCQSNVDCINPSTCVMGLCVPPMPGLPAPAPATSH
jgi:hypothetical protein